MPLADLGDWMDENSGSHIVWYVKRLSANDTLANGQLLPLWTGRAVNFVTSGSGWPFFHSPRGKSGISHGLNC